MLDWMSAINAHIHVRYLAEWHIETDFWDRGNVESSFWKVCALLERGMLLFCDIERWGSCWCCYTCRVSDESLRTFYTTLLSLHS
jgi:hypothetical protein